ncbi:hypothetical protein [Pajaroellobacter abortibovis]|uniref:Uncharacterized protein n=1 Tax=Pajaroellobacter abortibovis TaxID=1882918 RepID=A0A1L6MVD7_9BACT|nr:hypothetical protein [Pajaroellobacter abortibovis]APR99493.1 hypothetical protein BCY86_01445 [Pajaroellobacter abortibovis]
MEQRARQEAKQQQELQRLHLLEQMTSEEIVIEWHSRWIALLLFGVGQFQSGAGHFVLRS